VILAGIVAGIVGRAHRHGEDEYDPHIPRDHGGGVSNVTNSGRVLTDDVSEIALIGHGYDLDTRNQTVSIGWEILGCGEYSLTTVPIGDIVAPGCDALDRAADMYLNG